MTDRKVLILLSLCCVLLVACSEANPDTTDNPLVSENVTSEESTTIPSIEPYEFVVEDLADVRIDKENMEDYYITNAGDCTNIYTIDDNHVLWGSGQNQYGQLGLGTTDYDIHETPMKIAEHVVHVDYSGKGFVIYLTEDGTLYGLGNNGTGALLLLDTFSADTYLNGSSYAVTTPRELMKDVAYARCGQNDVAALKSDATAWTWGLTWYNGASYYYRPHAELIMEDVAFVTGNCGVAGNYYVSTPQQVASDVKMVWTGQLNYNFAITDITEDIVMPDALENTFIQKNDGTFWVCGINIGDTSNVISPYYELEEFETICTSDFYPCVITE